jgi:hypothetical protein
MAWVWAVAAGQDWVADTLQGRGVAGPYTLTWNRLVERSEMVLVETRWLVRDADYWIDYAAGQIRFAEPLRVGQTARVSYRITSGVSQRNTTTDVALDTELARWGPAALSLRGRIAGDPNRPTTDLGLRATWQESGREGEALYLMRNPRDDAPALLQLRSQWRTDTGWQGAFRFSRVDTDFGDAKPYGLASGQQSAEASLLFQPDANLRTRLQWSLTEPLQRRRARPATLERRTGLPAPAGAPLAGATHRCAGQPADTGDRPRRRAAAPHRHGATCRWNTRPRRRASARPSRRWCAPSWGRRWNCAIARWTIRSRDAPKRAASPCDSATPTVQGTVGLEQRWREDAQHRTAQLGLQAHLNPRLRVGGEYEAAENAGQMRGYHLQAQPISGLQLSLHAREYQGLHGLNLRSQQAQLDWQLGSGLTLSGQLAQNPLHQGAPQPIQREQYQLRWRQGAWDIEAGYTEQSQLGQSLIERRYLLGVRRRLDAYTLLGLSYQQSEWERDAFLRETAVRLGLTRQLTGFYLSLEAQLQLPRIDAQPQQRPNYSGSLRMGVQF